MKTEHVSRGVKLGMVQAEICKIKYLRSFQTQQQETKDQTNKKQNKMHVEAKN